MPLPRPGRVARIPEAAPTGRETLPELKEEEKAPPLGQQVEEAPALGRAFRQPAAVAPEEAAPWEDEEAEAEVVNTPQPAELVIPPPPAPASQPVVRAASTAVSQVAAGGANVNEVLAAMGFDGLDLGMGFGAFPTVVLKDDLFSTSDGDKLGNTFGCVVHTSTPKWIVKSNNTNDAEFKYTKDKVTDTSGRPLAATFNIWKAQGLMQGEPIWKPYLDVTAQLVDVNARELGQVVILQLPETSIERFKGYLTLLALSGIAAQSVVTQVYLGKQVQTKYPFYPWAFRKWGTLSQLGL